MVSKYELKFMKNNVMYAIQGKTKHRDPEQLIICRVLSQKAGRMTGFFVSAGVDAAIECIAVFSGRRPSQGGLLRLGSWICLSGLGGAPGEFV